MARGDDGALDDLLRRVGLDGEPFDRRRAARAAAGPRPFAGDRAEVQPRLRLLLCRAGRVRRRAEEHVDQPDAAARRRPSGRRRRARRASQPRLPRRRAAGQPAGAAGGDAAGARARRSARRQDLVLDHHQRHAADRGRRPLLRGLRLRGHRSASTDHASAHDALRPFKGGTRQLRRDHAARRAASAHAARHAGDRPRHGHAGEPRAATDARRFHRRGLPQRRLLADAERAGRQGRDATGPPRARCSAK